MNYMRKRVYHGRSKTGCGACRMRHIRCDEARPECNNCRKGGRLCMGYTTENPNTAGPLMKSPGFFRSQQEEDMFYRFTKKLAPMLEVFQASQFWTKSALATAQSSPQVFDGLLALQTLYDAPILTIMQPGAVAKRYQDAIMWYSRSIRASIDLAPQEHQIDDILLLLLSSYIYVLIEIRQAHHENTRALVCTAFSVAHSARICLLKSQSMLAFSCLEALLNITILGLFKSIDVARTQWSSVFAIVSRIATDKELPESTHLKLDLLDVTYNVHQAIEGDIDSYPGYMQIDHRLAGWYERLLQIESDASEDMMQRSRLGLLRSMYLPVTVHWRTYFDGPSVDSEYVKAVLKESIALADKLTLGSTVAKKLAPIWTVEGAFVPVCLSAAWYWRSQSLLELITQRLNTFWTPDRAKWIENVLDYAATLVNTDPGEATALELELFGEKPMAFLFWHNFTCVNHLLRTA